MFNKVVSSIGAFSYKNRKIISIFAGVLLILVMLISSRLVIEYSYTEDSIVNDIFPLDDTVVIVYENKDEEKIVEIIDYLEEDEHVSSIQAYANTLGAEMSPKDMEEMMGIPVTFVNTLFYIYENGMDTTGMSLVDFVNFMASDDFINNDLFASMIDQNSKSQILQLKNLVNAMASNQDYSADEIASILDIDKGLVQTIFLIAELRNANNSGDTLSLLANIANIIGLDAETIERIFGIKPAETLTLMEFVDVVLAVSEYDIGIMDEEQLSQIGTLENIASIIREERTITTEDLKTLFSSNVDNEMFNDNTITLLYIMARSNTVDMSNIRIPLYDFFIFLSEDIISNEAFSSFFDESVVSMLEEAKVAMQDGIAQLVGENHSRMVITINYEVESKEIYDFYERLNLKLDSSFEGEYYLVGATAMSDEVSKSFETEYAIISIVTAIAVFIVVWFTFKNFLLALMLIGIIECAVYSMMSVMVIIDLPIYFIPLILVQCILMGSMIDYGILFTTYYKEVRKEYSVDKALPEVMIRSTHSILTSSILIVAVTLICGRLMSGAVASILTTLGIGSLCAILLILFILPSLLTIFDKFIIKNKKEKVVESK